MRVGIWGWGLGFMGLGVGDLGFMVLRVGGLGLIGAYTVEVLGFWG